MMTERERIDFLIGKVAGGNQAAFARRIGVHPSVITRLGKQLRLTEHYINMITGAYPSVNADFLRDGESYAGEVDNEYTIALYDAKIKDMEQIIKSLQNENDRLNKIIDRLIRKM